MTKKALNIRKASMEKTLQMGYLEHIINIPPHTAKPHTDLRRFEKPLRFHVFPVR